MVGVVGSNPIAPTKYGSKNSHLRTFRGGFFIAWLQQVRPCDQYVTPTGTQRKTPTLGRGFYLPRGGRSLKGKPTASCWGFSESRHSPTNPRGGMSEDSPTLGNRPGRLAPRPTILYTGAVPSTSALTASGLVSAPPTRRRTYQRTKPGVE